MRNKTRYIKNIKGLLNINFDNSTDFNNSTIEVLVELTLKHI